MAKKLGYEVVATKPVCVDFPDGRSISYPPGTRFTASGTNTSVLRLLRTREIRTLHSSETVGAEPIKLGAPHHVQNLLKYQAEVKAARKTSLAKLAASEKAQPSPEPVDLASLPKLPKPSKQNLQHEPKLSDSNESFLAEDK